MAKKSEKMTGERKKATNMKRSGNKSDHKQAPGLGNPKPGRKPTRSAALAYVADLLAIEQLLHRYCHVLDRGTVDEIAELFHRDAVLLPVYESDDRHVGREAVRSWYAHYDETLRTGVRYLRHKIECPVIEISGDTATAISYLDADAIHKETDEPMIFIGRYDDIFVRDEGRWWFKERKIISYYIYSAGTYLEGRGE